jgi:hypothetical protein
MIISFNQYKLFEAFINVVDSYTSFNALKKYKNKKNIFIHFTDIQKLGVNPKKSHHDPHGIYFYPVSFFSNIEKFNQDFQYGISMKYFFICEVDTHNFLNINKITNDDIENFFKIANMLDIYNEFKDLNIIKRFRTDKKLWYILDTLNASPEKRLPQFEKLPIITWNNFFSKLSYDGLIDNRGIISESELKQIIVFNKKCIKILEHGENKNIKNYYPELFNKIKSLLNPTYYNIKFKTKHDSVHFMINMIINDVNLNVDVNFYSNEIIFFYINDDVIKNKKMDINIFGDFESNFIEHFILIVNNILKYNNPDKNKNVEDYLNQDFIDMLNNILSYYKITNIYYSKENIIYQDINSYLKIIYNFNNFYFEFYPINSNDNINFKFYFKDINEFKDKFNQRLNELIELKLISDMEKFNNYMKKYKNMIIF